MLKYILVFIAVIAACTCKKNQHDDPFNVLDQHFTHSLAYHYLWPFSQLVKAAAALDAETNLEEAQIVSDSEKLVVNLNVKNFKPDELKVKVKMQNIIIEGKHKERNGNKQQYTANHFVQRYALPAGSKQDEVTAVLKENGVLTVLVPKHDLPPPPPERDVPIKVLTPENKPETVVKETTTEKIVENDEKETTTEKKVIVSSSSTVDELDLVEATTHGKIRKKELKDSRKKSKDNEVTEWAKNEGIDYYLL